MSTVDERIVEMKIDNKQFLSGAKSTQSALSKLNDTVARAGNAKGMTQLGSAVDTVKHKFSLLNAAAAAAVGGIALKAADAGLRVAKAFTLDPIKAGFESYETQINAVKTILANTKGEGVGLKDVNQTLKQMQTYANKTVYNFAEMAHNVGTFTAAGVGLKQSAAAIKGIANLAALSGSNSQQAGTAMYQLSQAIAAGQVHLQDWNSVVNAGMGGKVFQTALARTAANMGTLDDGAVKLTGKLHKLSINGQSFRESMQVKPGTPSWLTSGVLTKTLAQFTGDMTNAQLAAQGFTKAQIKQIQSIAKAANSSATDIKTFSQMTQALKEEVATSYGNLFKAIFGGLHTSTKMWSALHITLENALRAPIDGLAKIAKGWVKLGGRSAVIQGIINLWHSLAQVFDAVGNAWDEAFPDSGSQAGKTLADISKWFERLTESLMPSKSALKDITDIFKAVFQILGVGANLIGNVYGYFLNLFGLFIDNGGGASEGILGIVAALARMISGFLKMTDLSDRIDAFFQHIEASRAKVLVPVIKTIGAIVMALEPLLHGDWSGFTTQFKAALTNLGPAFDVISNSFGRVQDFFASVGVQGTGVFNTIARAVGDAAGKIKGFIDNIVRGFDALKGGGDKQGGPAGATMQLTAATTDLTNGGNKFLSVMKAIGSGVKNLGEAIGHGISGIYDSIKNWLSGIDKFDLITLVSYIFTGAVIWQIRKFIKRFSEAWSGFAGIGNDIHETFEQLTGTLKTMQNQVKAKIIEEIAIAVGILAGSLWVLSRIPAKQLGLSLGAVSALLVEVATLMAIIGKGKMGDFAQKKLITMGASLTLIAFAMIEFATAVKILGSMSLGQLAKGLGSIAISMGLLVATMNSLPTGEVIKAAGAMVIMAFALDAMAVAIELYGHMKWDTFIGGLVKMGAALAVIVVAMNAMPTDKMLGNSAGMVLIAGSMVILATALEMLGHMSLWDIGKALVTLSLSLTILGVALQAVQDELPGAVGLAIVAGGLILLGHALQIMGSMSIGSIAKALITLTGALAILLAAAAGAEIVALGLEVLGSAVLMLGAGLALAGVGMGAFSAGLAVLVGLGTAAISVITAAIQAFLAMLPTIAIQVAAAFVSFFKAIADASPRIVNSFLKILHSLLHGVNKAMPEIVHTVDHFLNLMLNSVNKNVPKFGHTFQLLIDTGLKVLRKSVPEYVNTGLAIIDGVLSGIDRHLPHIMTEATNIVVDFINGISNHLTRVITAGTNLVIHLIQGIGQNGVRLANAAGKTILQFLTGIDGAVVRYSGRIGDEGRQIGFDLVNGLTGGLLGWGISQVQNAVSRLASLIPGPIKKILGIASPSKVMKRIGKWIAEGLAQGMVHSVNMVRRAGEIMAKNAIDAVSKTATDAQFAADIKEARADAYRTAAKILRHKENTEKLTKAQKKDLEDQAKEYDKAAKKAQEAADKAQHAVTSRRARRAAEARYRNADEQGKADILNKRADSAAKAAEKDRQRAAELSRAADLIRKKDADRAKELDKQAKQALASAEKAAKAAQHNAAQANLWAAKAVVKSVADVQKQIDADRAANEQAAKLAAMSDEEKQAYYLQQQKDEEAKSKSLYADAESKLAEARQERSKNARQARKDIAQANKDVAKAEAAKQAADDAAQNAAQYADQADQSANDSSSSANDAQNKFDLTMPDVAIASSRVYGAQNMFDAYAKALAATQAAVGKDTAPTIQFVQNNNSPKALSETEVYRQSKNLLSSAERKLAQIS